MNDLTKDDGINKCFENGIHSNNINNGNVFVDKSNNNKPHDKI